LPIIQVQVLKGRSNEQIKSLIGDLTEAAVKNLSVRPEQVRILVTEFEDTHWAVGTKTMNEIKKDLEER